MKKAVKKLRPAGGYAHGVHLLLTILLPILVYIFVRINLVPVAVSLVLLSKWRVLAVRPRHWMAYIRANAVDIVVGLSIVIFMSETSVMTWQLVWAAVYAVWLLLLKPSATLLGISLQASVAQLFGLMALYLTWGGSSTAVIVLGTWAVTYVAARHFFSAFDEPYTRFLTDAWAFFGASLAWVLSHWLVFYGAVAQPTLLLTILGYGLGTMYYLEQNDRLGRLLRRQFIFIMLAIVVVILVFSDWGNKVV
jgi:hypothetical protein